MSQRVAYATLEPTILEALKVQNHKKGLSEVLNVAEGQADWRLREMVREGKVIVLGTAEQAGYTDVRKDVYVYGLPGMKLVHVGELKQKESLKKAGKIEIRGFKWGVRGLPW